jgi:hypothetical protein
LNVPTEPPAAPPSLERAPVLHPRPHSPHSRLGSSSHQRASPSRLGFIWRLASQPSGGRTQILRRLSLPRRTAETRNLPLPREGGVDSDGHSATPTTPATTTPTSPAPPLLRSRSAATASSPSRSGLPWWWRRPSTQRLMWCVSDGGS